MGAYRDDLESAQLRNETLEQKLAASEAEAAAIKAEAAANEAEANELRRRVERLDRQLGELQSDGPTRVPGRPTSRRRTALGTVLVACCALGFAAAFVPPSAAENAEALPPLPKLTLPRTASPKPAPHPAPKHYAGDPSFVLSPSPPGTPTTKLPAPGEPAKPGEFDREAARRALVSASRRAATCPGAVAGRDSVVVAFSPNGHVSSVGLTPQFEAGDAAPCILELFLPITVPPYEGSIVSGRTVLGLR